MDIELESTDYKVCPRCGEPILALTPDEMYEVQLQSVEDYFAVIPPKHYGIRTDVSITDPNY